MSSSTQERTDRTRQNQSSSGSNNRGSGKNTGNNRQRHRGADTPEVRLSKALSWLLRHNAVSQGVKIRPDGYVLVGDVLSHSRFKGFTYEDIQAVVNSNDKKRFEILDDNEDNMVYIRAVQGHSIKKVAEVGHEEILDASQLPVLIHGTYFAKWDPISKQGLSKMNRNHIHMAVGLPGENGVISGMRGSCNMYIYIDTEKAFQDEIKFYRSSNNVILSDGKNGDGIIPPLYFQKVVKSSGEVIYPAN